MGQQTGGCSAMQLLGTTSVTPIFPNTCWCEFRGFQIQAHSLFDSPLFLPVWYPRLFYLQWCTYWKHPWFGMRCFSLKHSETHNIFCLDVSLFDQLQSQAPVWIFSKKQVSERAWDCLVQGKVAIPAESDQFYCHIVSKAEIKTCAGNIGKLYHAESPFLICTGTFTTCRNIEIHLQFSLS